MTILDDPMPAEFTVIQLSDSDAELLLSGRGIWHSNTLSVIIKPEELWPTESAVES